MMLISILITIFSLMSAWVRKIVLLMVLALGLWYWQFRQVNLSAKKSQAREQVELALQAAKDNFNQSVSNTHTKPLTIAQIQAQWLNKVTVADHGEIIKILPDDEQGKRHQRFIVRTSSGTVLIVHNIGATVCLPNIKIGDQIDFQCEFIQNRQGGLKHWTHCGVYECKG